ncbi:MAG: hypothetical protein WCO57_10715 [Verrucomicrobiota bacterium]
MIRHIEIDACLNGFIVRCGCQTLAYTSINSLTKDIGEYLADPDATEKRLVGDAINRKHTYDNMPQALPATPSDCCASEPCGQTATGITRLR